MLTYRTAGESHGKGLAAFVEGFPAGLTVDKERIDAELVRRQGGYGRGARQTIESDSVEILTGVLHGRTTGAPILLWVKNRDVKIEEMPDLTRPRPGHADLAGSLKYRSGIRGILERSSARETAARVAAGALTAGLLGEFGIAVRGWVAEIGTLELNPEEEILEKISPKKIDVRRGRSSVYSLTPERDGEAEQRIDACGQSGDTLGGVIEVRAWGVPVGLGSHVQWTEKLDANLARAVMSIQAMKGVEIGLGFETARLNGSACHDAIRLRKKQIENAASPFMRPTNRAGGIEGGMSNGEPIRLRAAMKPIATLKKPLESVDLTTRKKSLASYERSDVCAVPAASVAAENVVAFELAAALIEKLGGDSLDEMRERIRTVWNRE